MADRGRAHFVYAPRRIDDLLGVHSLRDEKPFAITKRVSLSALDYENFTYDLWADRAYLVDTADNRWDAPSFLCVFVHRHGRKEGILVVPTPDGPVRYAAYWTAEK